MPFIETTWDGKLSVVIVGSGLVDRAAKEIPPRALPWLLT